MSDQNIEKIKEQKLGEIAGFIQGLNLKKTFYGLKPDQVYNCMQELNTRYQQLFTQIETETAGRLSELQQMEAALQKAMTIQKSKIADEEKIGELEKQLKETEERLSESRNELDELKQRIKDEQHTSGDYQKKAQLLADTVVETREQRNDVLAKAEMEAERLVRRAKKQADDIIVKAHAEAEQLNKESEAAFCEMKRVKQKANEDVKRILDGLDGMKADIQGLQISIEGITERDEGQLVELPLSLQLK